MNLDPLTYLTRKIKQTMITFYSMKFWRKIESLSNYLYDSKLSILRATKRLKDFAANEYEEIEPTLLR